ncbi:MAG: dienelactone hydrolase family protein, partial [Betaproteobacteria bacterium]
MGTMLELTAADGFRLSAYRADPDGMPRGALVVVQEIFGVNSHIKSVCDGFAADGYLALAPALFDRVERNVDLGYTEADVAAGRELKAKSGIDNALLDIAAARDTVAGAGKVGIVGYCWGGYVTWMAASRSTGIACAVPYYGGGMIEA